MPRKPTPPPAELARVRQLTEQIEQLQTERLRALVAAKLAGATGQQLADAAGIARSKVYDALRAGGYDPKAWR